MKRTYLITGASSELGLAYIKYLEDHNIDCVVLGQYYSNSAELEIMQKECKYVELHLYRCDLSVSDSVMKLISDIRTDGYRPDHILHLAAAKLNYVRIHQFDWEDYVLQSEIQVHSFVEIVKHLIRDMSKQRYGRIVIMLSECTLGTPPRFMSGYVMIKYQLLGLVKSLAVEYEEKGITVNGISPGMMETKFLSNMDDRIIQMNAEDSPMKRNLTVDETVEAIEFFMSEKASYITGSNFNISGGRYM